MITTFTRLANGYGFRWTPYPGRWSGRWALVTPDGALVVWTEGRWAPARFVALCSATRAARRHAQAVRIVNGWRR